MSREEAIDILIREKDEDMFVRTEYRNKIHEALNMAIQALEQEPSGDAISRQAVIDCFKKWQPYMATRLHEFEKELFDLSSVKPQEPCEDYISRQAVKEQMIKYGFHAPDMTVTEFVEDLPPVTPQPKTEWIPVSERLPEEGVDILACFYTGEGNYKMMVSRRSDYNYWSGVGRTADMVAWMPLPEPYKVEPQESEDKE